MKTKIIGKPWYIIRCNNELKEPMHEEKWFTKKIAVKRFERLRNEYKNVFLFVERQAIFVD